MSKLNVNSIEPSTGTTLTLGASGDTVTAGTGVITSGFSDEGIKNDIALLGFKVAANGSLAKYNLVDQTIDDFQDASGVDAGASTDETLTSGFYSGVTTVTGGTTGQFTGDGTFGVDGTVYGYNIFKVTGTHTSSSEGYEDISFVTGGTISSLDYLVVAGGGSAGSVNGANGGSGGAGGGGGVLTSISQTGSSALTSLAAGTHTVRIGLGGANQPSSSSGGYKGGSSKFINSSAATLLTAIGGGYGGDPDAGAGGPGGSGGGGSENGSEGSGTEGPPRQGYDGGDQTGKSADSAGGGGWAAVGSAGSGNDGGAGGAGNTSTIIPHAIATTNSVGEVSGGQVYFAGGGGGGCDTGGSASVGGLGGGGNGNTGNGAGNPGGNTGGDNATGGGGGAGGRCAIAGSSGPGGSGVVILRYALPYSDMTLVSTTTTAQAAPTKGDIVFTYTNGAGSTTLGTDVTAEYSADGGSTWTSMTLGSEGSTGGHNIATAHDVALTSTSGTSMAYRIKTLNQSASKTTRIQAVSLGWS